MRHVSRACCVHVSRALELYSGSNKWLKHVCEVGKLMEYVGVLLIKDMKKIHIQSVYGYA